LTYIWNLPPYLRKTKSIEELIPWLYLKGMSTGDFSAALAALLGPDAPGLSASTVTRLKGCWEDEYQQWSKRSLDGKRYVYVWADGIHFNIRLEEDRPCILMLMGATEEEGGGRCNRRDLQPDRIDSGGTTSAACATISEAKKGRHDARKTPDPFSPRCFGRSLTASMIRIISMPSESGR
jgi:hypothetical protein